MRVADANMWNGLHNLEDRLKERFIEMADENERLKSALRAMAEYPPPGHDRRTDDGYPVEFDYDEFAYKRMVDSYRDYARESLGEERKGEG